MLGQVSAGGSYEMTLLVLSKVQALLPDKWVARRMLCQDRGLSDLERHLPSLELSEIKALHLPS